MIQVTENVEPARDLVQAWHSLVGKLSGMPGGVGPMCRPEISLLALRVRGTDWRLRIYHHNRDGQVSAILPCYVQARTNWLVNWIGMGVVIDLYPGRTAVLADPAYPGLPREFLTEVFRQKLPWDVLTMTVVAGTCSDTALLEAAHDMGLSIVVAAEETCPYIEFQSSWDAFMQSRPAKFRYNLRSREAKLRAQGHLQLRRHVTLAEASSFLEYALEIDRNSWKEKTGTSITQKPDEERFYRDFLPLAAGAGLLCSFLLVLDVTPIACLTGLLDQGVFYNLKSSFRQDCRKLSPGVVLKAMIMKELAAEGVRFWDFVGLAETHKMQWATGTYALRHYFIYNRTWKGTILKTRFHVGQLVRHVRGASIVEDEKARSDGLDA